MDTKTVFSTCGWIHYETGGGCTAYRHGTDSSYFLATSYDDTYIPEWAENIAIGEYDSEDEGRNFWVFKYDEETNSYWYDGPLPQTLADLLAALKSPEDK